ncbi:MAG: hypothetical protein M0R51_16600 [Clostridia bacterium]|jgi:hypothetical protein|nr:hypothetical protein [Clostridia bacterium]
MINSTTLKIPKKYQPMIEFVDVECSTCDNTPVYWIYLNPGFCFGYSGWHLCNGLTQTEISDILSSIQPCNCEECCEVIRK